MASDDERREVARSCDLCEYRPVCNTRRTCGDSAWCCSTYKKRIDRDALLRLAGCVRKMGEDCDKLSDFGLGTTFRAIADRIRGALGVTGNAQLG